MKLRNKKTGEVVEVESIHTSVDGRIMTTCVLDGLRSLGIYDSLTEFNAEWEDYEEPKKYWYISPVGEVYWIFEDDEGLETSKQIGNYFESREEAKRAVEKLKAWKRLKSHNLFISKGNRTFVNTDDVFVAQNVQFRIDTYGDVEEDLDLLFGGEE